ncbi:hypothetical protein SynPROSU1_01872 [Synechococcus sp. PROS-U-1]|nr:hypothetical protein SynPROSU1_01872 [Synechococcus sp. PROS-U-1]
MCLFGKLERKEGCCQKRLGQDQSMHSRISEDTERRSNEDVPAY